jgi:hypothetical protein
MGPRLRGDDDGFCQNKKPGLAARAFFDREFGPIRRPA